MAYIPWVHDLKNIGVEIVAIFGQGKPPIHRQLPGRRMTGLLNWRSETTVAWMSYSTRTLKKPFNMTGPKKITSTSFFGKL